MRKSVYFFVCGALVLGTLFLTGCSEGGTTSAAKMSDSDLESAIKGRLDSNVQVRDANIDIDASVERNEAILTGKVPSQDVKDKALELARDSRRALIVVDRIEVERRDVPRAEYTEEMAVRQRSRARELGDTIGDSIGDAWVHAKITTRLVADMDTPARKINVDVDDNRVTLRGEVSTAKAKADAERIARETDGVKSVKNLLTVRPG